MFYYIFRISDCGFRIPKNPSFFGLFFRIFGLIRIRAKNPRIDNPDMNTYLLITVYAETDIVYGENNYSIQGD